MHFTIWSGRRRYVVAVKALPKFADEYAESPYTYVHVITDDLEQSATRDHPRMRLCLEDGDQLDGEPEAAAYEYTPRRSDLYDDGRTITLGAGAMPRNYTFTVRAMTFRCNALHQLRACRAAAFTTSTEDIPTLLIAPTQVISDAVEFQI